MDKSTAAELLRQKFPAHVQCAEVFRGETTVTIAKEKLREVMEFLKEDKDTLYDLLVDLAGVDLGCGSPRFQVVYHLCAMRTRLRLRLKVTLADGVPRVASVVSVWKGANWLEREAFDMFGITFAEHPDLRRILLTPDWEGHPLRKDYPLQG